MSPSFFRQTVVERQRRHIEAEIGGALHVGMSAKDVGTSAGNANVACGEKKNAARTNIRRSGRELGLSHCPDQCRGFLLGKDFGDVPDLCLRQTGDAFDLVWRPLRYL